MNGRVDGHVHARGRYAALADYHALLDAGGVERVVLVQQLGLYDNAALLAEADDPRVVAVVVGVDLASPNANGRIAKDDPKVAGIRLALDGPWCEPADPKVWNMVEERGFVLSIPPAFARIASGEVARLARAHPDILIRLEHVGGTPFARIGADDPEFRNVLELAKHANVCITWSGFFHQADDAWPYPSAHAHLRACLEQFGPARIGWSGDLNRPELTEAAYRQEARLLEALDFLGDADRDSILTNSLVREELHA
jgi:predicted TIM-barrel fold metal-dependent hydrolase